MTASISIPDGFLVELQALRRDFHQIPEVGLQLPQTQARILAELDGLGLEITLGDETSSIVAVLRGGRPGPTVLLRGDMDALPVTELTGLPFASTNGAMHACGHDLHITGLIGAVRLLAAQREALPGTIVFMFQPGEEGYDGAGVMLREGLLDAAGERPVAAYGVHVEAGDPLGVVITSPGILMAGFSVLDVRVVGKGGHGSAPHFALDPITVGAEIVTALQTYVTRRFDVFDPVVLTVGEFHGGSAPNVIPGEATLRAGVRSFSPETAARIDAELPEVARSIAHAHGLEAEATSRQVLPATINDAAEAAAYAATARDLFGEQRVVEAPNPRTGSEDFSRVLNEVPGSYGFIGAAVDYEPANPPASNHSPYARFDDAVLADQAQLLATLALRRLESGV